MDFAYIPAIAAISFFVLALFIKKGSPHQIGLYFGAIAFMWMAMTYTTLPITQGVYATSNIVITQGGQNTIIAAHNVSYITGSNPQGEQVYIESWFGWIFIALSAIFALAGVLGRMGGE